MMINKLIIALSIAFMTLLNQKVALANCIPFRDDRIAKRDQADQDFKTVPADLETAGRNTVFSPDFLSSADSAKLLRAAALVPPKSCTGPLPQVVQPAQQSAETCEMARDRLSEFENNNEETALLNGTMQRFYSEQVCIMDRSPRDVSRTTASAAIANLSAQRNLALANVSLIKSAQRRMLANRCSIICESEANRDLRTCDNVKLADANLTALSPTDAKDAKERCDKVVKLEENPRSRAASRGDGLDMSSIGQALSALGGILSALNQQGQLSTDAPQAFAGVPPLAQDCSNPSYASTNVLCICQADPKSAMCQKGEQFPIGLSTSGGPVGPSSPSAGSDGLPSDGTPLGPPGGQAKTASGSATTEGGGGGGGFGGGGKGLQSINGGGNDGDGKSGVPTNVIQGTAGGGGSGGGGGFGGGPNGNAPGKYAQQKDPKGLNLKDMLPKWRNRSVAGMSISAKDGMTAPLGPSMFEKVSRQYQTQREKRVFIEDR